MSEKLNMRRVKKYFGENEYGLTELPTKNKTSLVSRLIKGPDRCLFCALSRMHFCFSKKQDKRCWKNYRKFQYRNKKEEWFSFHNKQEDTKCLFTNSSIFSFLKEGFYALLLCFFSRIITRIKKSAFLSSNVVLSRLYGYKKNLHGEMVQVESEAKIIQIVFDLIADGHSPSEVKTILDQHNMRNRAGHLFTVCEIKSLIRPIFAGLVKNRFGFNIRSSVYQPIVSTKVWKKARNKLKSRRFGASYKPSDAHSGVVMHPTALQS